MGPSFLHTSKVFWLDFQGLGLLGGLKSCEKHHLGKHVLFEFKSIAPKSVFYDMGMFFGSSLRALGRPKITESIFSLGVSFQKASRVAFKALLVLFWSHLGTTLVVFVSFYFFEKRCCVFLDLYIFRGHSGNNSFTCMGVSFSRFRVIFLLIF